MKSILLTLTILCAGAEIYAAEFIQGFYMVPTNDAAYRKAKSLGVNYVQLYQLPFGKEGLAATRKQLDLAQAHGLKVALNLLKAPVFKRENYQAELREIIREFKDHPALGYWYLFDEPSGKEEKEKLQEAYRILKEESPNIPVALCLAQNADWREFTDCSDILIGDVYPVADEPFPEAPLQYYMNFMRDLAAYGKPVIVIPQFMNWERYPKVKRKEDGYKTLRFPTPQELRFFCFGALTLGKIRGVFWYSFYDTSVSDPAFFDKAAPVLLEFRQFTDLLKDTENPVLLRWAEESQFPTALFDGKDGERYLVIANEWPTPRRYSRWAEDRIPGNWKLIPWGSTRNVSGIIQDNRIDVREKLDPWEVLVLKLAKEEKQ